MAATRVPLAAMKAEMRAQVRAKLRALSPDIIQTGSKAVAAKLLTLPYLESCSGVGVFLSMRCKKTGRVRGEIDSAPIISRLLTPHGRCKPNIFVPKVTDFSHGGMEMLRLSSGASEVEGYSLNRWNIPEPSEDQVCGVFVSIPHHSLLRISFGIIPH